MSYYRNNRSNYNYKNTNNDNGIVGTLLGILIAVIVLCLTTAVVHEFVGVTDYVELDEKVVELFTPNSEEPGDDVESPVENEQPGEDQKEPVVIKNIEIDADFNGPYTIEYEVGMTWGEWLESKYNTNDFVYSSDSGTIVNSDGLSLYGDDANLALSDIIEDSIVYYFTA